MAMEAAMSVGWSGVETELATVREVASGVERSDPSSISKEPSNHIPNCAGGEDTAVISHFIRWENWPGVEKVLADSKAEALATGRAVKFRFGRNLDAEMTTVTHRTDGGPFWSYVVKVAGFELHIMKVAQCAPKGSPMEFTPNVICRIGSVALQQFGASLEWFYRNRVVLVFERLGAVEVRPARPSRIDACVDVLGVSVDEVAKRKNAGMIVSRARKRDLWDEDASDVVEDRQAMVRREETELEEGPVNWAEPCPEMVVRGEGRSFTNVAAGMGGDISCRIYDKTREARFDEVKTDLLRSNLKLQEDKLPAITRAEWQMRLGFLKDFGVETLEDYFQKRAEVMAYLSRKWLRFTDELPGKNPQRAKVWSGWQLVCDVVSQVFGFRRPGERSPPIAITPRLERFEAQAAGLLTTILAREGMSYPQCPEEFVEFVVARTREAVVGQVEKWWGRYEKERDRWAVVHCPGLAVVPF